ncbi:HAD-IA family hydrolase [Chromobacterium sp. IIBBL 290-4]|uniref:HAD-IA family hydrolase n=1 Tax=Chromobacterium sp. IIBBL 290-4 TaxID=2953890 RepID=UPI0020B88FD0|nr:HAD-IA family hydrolase [Chromobacterium sp. IIBBL 290-4]UTH73561.1 HAD-IA family hydrolase [Chromobacterium sp. IIBBL 290-4]
MIQAVFFDYDGVLTTDKYGSDTTNRYLSQASGLPFERIDQAMDRYNDELLLGKLTHQDIWADLCRDLEYPLDIGWLDAAFRSTPRNDAMFDLARQLKGRYRLGIITDNKLDRMICLAKHQDLDALFDPIVVSARLGFGKQDSEIFQHALAQASLPAEACLFIDNSQRNLEVAANLGMATLHHDDGKNDVGRLRSEIGALLDFR